MKKIDLHIHTVATDRDSHFNFCIETLQWYVQTAKLDAIAITNHNTFDAAQYRQIRDSIPIVVFPGIEINIDDGHILLISDRSNIEEFESMCNEVCITQVGTKGITVDRLKEIYGDLQSYLIIPHYGKAPSIRDQTLTELFPFIAAGEVDSPKKFIRAIKDDKKLSPVLFSDVRISEELRTLPIRHTFLDCGELTLSAIKTCISDKRKVTLSENEGNSLIQVFEDGQQLSTGLNVLLGDHSTGKTYTLNKIDEVCDNVKYIRQFSLVQQDEATYERDFNNEIQRRRTGVVDRYLSSFKAVLEDVMKVDLYANERSLEKYICSLLQSAEEADRRDAFSKVTLFDATTFPERDDNVLKDLIASVRQVIENIEYREIIEKHINKQALKRLACELIELLWNKTLENKKLRLVNWLIKDIKANLKIRTSAVQIEDVDLYKIKLEMRKAARFSEIVKVLQKTAVIYEESIQGFRVVATKGAFAKAAEIKIASGNIKTSFSSAMKEYNDPYPYLRILMSDASLNESVLHKLFAKIEYKILNRDGFEVSGGERSEFRLLQEIKDAQNYDILLIDEPESSFDNMFLNSDVNQIIRKISESMPVVVVTHNNTVGASIGADYLLYASKVFEDKKTKYMIYSGHPTDKFLRSTNGQCIGTHEIMLNSLEAGMEAYENRRRGYAAIEDRK